jgi:hypothetical protein
MKPSFDKLRLFIVLSGSLVAACGSSREPMGSSSASSSSSSGAGGASMDQCETALDCSSGGDACQQWVCEQHRCVEQNAPAGSLPGTSMTVPPCHRLVCDGDGGESVVIDPSVMPPQDGVPACQKAVCDAMGQVVTMPDPTAAPPDDMPGDCQRPACDAKGDVTSVPDPTDLPADVPGDCRLPACTASGMPTFTPDPTDVPPNTVGDCETTTCDDAGNVTYTPDPADVPADIIKGDCMAPGCDAAGNVISVDADDPPAMEPCMSYTCQSGEAVGAPANPGKNCSTEGFICSTAGTCDVCPAADATCSDPGPGDGAYSLGTEHDFGSVGYCDDDGYSMCDALHAGVTAYFGYTSDGSFSFCDFDPDVNVKASATVTLCEYFTCPSVTCPAGSLPATQGGLPGCCATGTTLDMAISPSCSDTQTYITVESKSAACTTYELAFHS